ncbi:MULTISPECIES: hypothetical protein [Anaerosinus]|uniref:Uncharacterized protein n=1 Tax=Selenobaculum gibii TaxID=3054208 RepID=A0A9Y2ERX5_9FIRM|nr:hypothetical protein [Selenobaculum gbiensis]WIW69706.1 hypothetical protein P3F81_07185 [Selenobaculum gbiensis]
MVINGAVIKEQGVTFAIISVKPHVTRYTVTAIEARQNYAAFFPNMPIILMSQNEQGVPRFVGRKDIVDFLKTIKIEQIPWKQYHVY